MANSHEDRVEIFSATGTPLGQWGSQGSGNGQFNDPVEVAISSDGTVYVTDVLNHRVQAFCLPSA
jgi:DNA-binding beta-propeller fold protein YncE